MTGLFLSERMINWSDFLKLSDPWDFPAVSLSVVAKANQ